jgi:hypothetical protein
MELALKMETKFFSETLLFFIVREEYRLREFNTRIFRRIFGVSRREITEKLVTEVTEKSDVHNSYASCKTGNETRIRIYFKIYRTKENK